MVVRASEILNLYKFPPGRCVFALQSVADRAKAVGAHEIAELAGRALAQAKRTMDMALRMRAGYSGQYPPEAMAMDTVVDRYLGALAGYFDVEMRMYADEPRGEAAQKLAQALFPDGVAALTHLPFTEEHAGVQSLLARARSADLAEYVRTLPELPAMLDRLARRNDEYGDLLRQLRDVPSRDDMRQARAACQDLLAETASLIIGLYALRSPDSTEERDHLLEPILEQNEALRVIRRRRRVPADIDPETGEDLPDENAPDNEGNAPAQAAASPDDAPVT